MTRTDADPIKAVHIGRATWQGPESEAPGDHIGDGNKMGGPGDLISRAVGLLAEWESTPKEGDPMIDVLLGVIGEALGLLRILPAAAQGATSCELCGSLIKEGNCFCNWSPSQGEPVARCQHCDDTGDVIRADGEWLGKCDCNASLRAEVERLRYDSKKGQIDYCALMDRFDAAQVRIAELEAERDRLLAVERLYDTAVQLAAMESREGALEQAKAGAQCCMCGKKGLSTPEDGGPECELSDGRWTCSSKCWEMASDMAGAATVKPLDLRRAVQDGYDTWAAKPHNTKWVRRIDGTPIPNDLIVCIQGAVVAALTQPAQGGEGGAA